MSLLGLKDQEQRGHMREKISCQVSGSVGQRGAEDGVSWENLLTIELRIIAYFTEAPTEVLNHSFHM